MATTQLPIKGVFDTTTGKLVGLATPSAPEIPIATALTTAQAEAARSAASAKSSRPKILFFGDSISGWDNSSYNQNMTRSTSAFPYGNALNVKANSWANVSGSGTLRFDKTKAIASWQAPGDTQGPDVDVSVAGIYTLPSGTASKTLSVIARPSTYSSGTDGAATITITAGTEFAVRNHKSYGVWAQAKCQNGFDADFIGCESFQIREVTDAASRIAVGAYDGISVLAGTNDLGGRTLDQMKADFLALIDVLKTKTTVVFGLTLLPRTLGMTTAMRQMMAAYNQWIMSLRIAGFHPVNVFSYLVDQSSATGDPLAGMIEDGVHPAPPGAEAAATPWAAAATSYFQFDYASVLSSQADTYDATINPQGNQAPLGGSFAGTTGDVSSTGMSGQLATGWFGTRVVGSNITCAFSKVARTDGVPGTAQRLTITNSGGGNERVGMTFNNSFYPTAAAGQVWKLQGAFSIVSSTGLGQFVATLAQRGMTPRFDNQWGLGFVGGAVITGARSKMAFETIPVTVQTGVTSLDAQFDILVSAGGAVTIDFMPGEMKLLRLS